MPRHPAAAAATAVFCVGLPLSSCATLPIMLQLPAILVAGLLRRLMMLLLLLVLKEIVAPVENSCRFAAAPMRLAVLSASRAIDKTRTEANQVNKDDTMLMNGLLI